MYNLTGLQRDALHIIAGSDGKVEENDIKNELERLYGRELKEGALLSSMRQLHRNGFVHRHWINGRKYGYTTTRRGELNLVERREWEDSFPNSITPILGGDEVLEG